jgi:hypothetical protein
VTNEPLPTLMDDGLAMYATGEEPPVLLVASQHGFVTGPTSAGPLHRSLLGLGVTVVTFNPPGAFASNRPARLDLNEMTGCCAEVVASGVRP